MLSYCFEGNRAKAMWSSRVDPEVLAHWGSSPELDFNSDLQSAFDQEMGSNVNSRVRYLRPRQVHGSLAVELGVTQEEALDGTPVGEDVGSRVGPTLNVGDAEFVEADAVIAWTSRTAPVVLAADCLPIALYCCETSGVAAVHGGWRGLLGGVLSSASSLLRRGGSGIVLGAVGPYIHRECYEFLGPEQELVVGHFGKDVVDQGHLDLTRVLGSACDEAGVELVFDAGICTGCDPRYPSARKEGTKERLALAVGMRE
jgi:copper oxidase (laccase) domain-containing protein